MGAPPPASRRARYPRSRKRDEVLWFQALSQLRGNNSAAAATTLGELLQLFPRSSLVPQASYWQLRARELGKSGATAELISGYTALASTWPGTLYGVLSSERVRALGGSVPPCFPMHPVSARLRFRQN